MKDIAIRVENLGKRYHIGKRESYQTLRDTLTDTITAPFRWLRRGKSAHGNVEPDHIWALKDVSFEIPRGEVVGIIGRNGAGKSTLLKVLSRITEPTEGHAEIHGRVGSLLEVGTGFHPELTGRENIYLNGAILGMRRVEITRQFDEIVAFSEIEKFLDTPVKHFSSGMYMRLAFAVAAHLKTDILIVDEVLAVGDSEFQKKCLRKMQDVSQGGRTVVFVSHNMGAITRLCPRSIWIENGSVLRDGPSTQLVAEYQAMHLDCLPEWIRGPRSGPLVDFEFVRVRAEDAAGELCAMFDGTSSTTIRIEYQVSRMLQACQIGARVYNAEGLVVFTTADSDEAGVSALPKAPGMHTASFSIPGRFLAPGTYFVQLGAHMPGRHVYDAIDKTVVFEVTPTSSLSSLDGRLGLVAPLLTWDLFIDTRCAASISR